MKLKQVLACFLILSISSSVVHVSLGGSPPPDEPPDLTVFDPEIDAHFSIDIQ